MDRKEALARRRKREKRWRENNPEKLKAQRQAYNKKRNLKRAQLRDTPEYIEAKAQRNEERKRKIRETLQARFAGKPRAKPKTPKQRMSPEKYEKYLEYMREKNRKRRALINSQITDKEREDRRRRHREKITKALRERARKIRMAKEAQERANPKPVVKRAAPPPKPPAPVNVKKPGRIVALCGWSRF